VTGNNDNPTGLLFAAGLNEIANVGALSDYDPFLDAYGLVLSANGTPNAWVMGTSTQMVLAKTKTGIGFTDGTSTLLDKTQLGAPTPLAALPRFATTSLNNLPSANLGPRSSATSACSASACAPGSRWRPAARRPIP